VIGVNFVNLATTASLPAVFTITTTSLEFVNCSFLSGDLSISLFEVLDSRVSFEDCLFDDMTSLYLFIATGASTTLNYKSTVFSTCLSSFIFSESATVTLTSVNFNQIGIHSAHPDAPLFKLVDSTLMINQVKMIGVGKRRTIFDAIESSSLEFNDFNFANATNSPLVTFMSLQGSVANFASTFVRYNRLGTCPILCVSVCVCVCFFLKNKNRLTSLFP